MALWSIIFYICNLFFIPHFNHVSFLSIIKEICINFINGFWFVWALIFCYLFTYITLYLLRLSYLLTIILYLLIFLFVPDTFLRIGYFLHFKVLFPFYLLGTICCKYNVLHKLGLRISDKVWDKPRISSIIIICTSLYIILWWLGDGSLFLYNLNLTFYNQPINEIIHNITGFIFILFSGIIGIILLMILCDLITIFTPVPKFILIIGSRTLSIYFIQTVFFNVFIKHISFKINNSLMYFLSSFLVLGMCYLITIPLSHSKYTSYLLLGKKIKSCNK